MKAVLATAALCALSVSIHAQIARADPSDPAVRGLPLEVGTAFKTYQPYREDKRRSWREANDEVERLGGHQGHLSESRPATVAPAPTQAPAPTPAPTPKPAAPDHRHHRH